MVIRIFLRLFIVALAMLVCTSAASAQDEAVASASFYLNPELTFAANPSTGFNPSIAYNTKHDEYLVVWNGIWVVEGQRVSSRGELLGQKWSIASSGANLWWPDVAYDETNDRYLVVWERTNGSNQELFGRILPWDGPSALWPEFAIDTTHYVYDQPNVAYAQTQGEFMVVWPAQISRIEVWGRRIRASDGALISGSFAIATDAGENRGNPAIAYNLHRNEYLIVYDDSELYTSHNDDILATRMTAGGVNLGAFTIAGWPDDEFRPAVAACHSFDNYLVAWTSNLSGSDQLYAYFVNGDGTMGSIHHLDTSTTGQPDSVMDITCRWGVQFFITWEHWDTVATATAIWGRLLYADESMDASFEIAPASTNRQDPAVATSGTNFLVAWEKTTSTYPDLVGRIVGDTAPVARFTFWPPSGYVTDDFQLDATACSDEQTPSANLQVRWDWTDDGTYDTNWSTTQKLTHKFSVPGTNTIRMQVQDEYGLKDSTTDTVNIYNTYPKTAFTVNPSVGPPGTVFQFDASTSSDLETPVSALQVRWDWEGDGVFDTAWSTTKTESHAFTGSGYYYPVLEVRDAQGLIGQTTHQVWVDNKPAASFTVTPARGTVNTAFQFDGSGSSDPDITAPYSLIYLWDWENDGTYDTSWSTEATPSHTYVTAGTYTARLQVRQSADSLSDTTTRQVIVDPLPEQAPHATFVVTPTVGTPSQVFQFDASGCTDSNGSNATLEFRWDWEDDGAYDTSWSQTATPSHTYAMAGTYTVRLEVRQISGSLTDTTTRQVVVNSITGQAPHAMFMVTPAVGTPTQVFQFDASGCTDPDGSSTALEIRWDWENDGVYDTSWSTDKTATHVFGGGSGTVTVRLMVRDSQGLTAVAERAVTISANPGIKTYLPSVNRQ